MDTKRFYERFVPTAIVALAAAALLFVATSCSPFQAIESLSVPSQAQVNQVKRDVDAYAQTLARLEAYVKDLPTGSSARTQQEELISVLKQAKTVQEAWLKSAETGDTSELAKLVGQLPYIGPWAGLAVTLLGYLRLRGKNGELIQQAGQIVKSIDEAFPNKSEAQKNALDAVQDTDTKALVAKLKGEL